MNKKLLYKVKINNFEDLHVFLVETEERKTLVGFALPNNKENTNSLSKGIRVVFVKVVENKLQKLIEGDKELLSLIGTCSTKKQNFFYTKRKVRTPFYKDFSFLTIQKTRAPSNSY